MKDTSDIRKENISHIRQMLFKNKKFTVQEIKEMTGLCTATCNTVLNILCQNNEVKKELVQLNGVGRKTALYELNLEYDKHLDVQVVISENEVMIHFISIFIYGGQKDYFNIKLDLYNDEILIDEISKYVKNNTSIKEIVIGFPDGFLYNKNLEERLRKITNTDVCIDYDVNYIALSIKEYTAIVSFNKNEYPRLLIIKDECILNNKILDDIYLPKIEDEISCDVAFKYISIIKNLVNPKKLFIYGNLIENEKLEDIFNQNNLDLELLKKENLGTSYIVGMGIKFMKKYFKEKEWTDKNV